MMVVTVTMDWIGFIIITTLTGVEQRRHAVLRDLPHCERAEFPEALLHRRVAATRRRPRAAAARPSVDGVFGHPGRRDALESKGRNERRTQVVLDHRRRSGCLVVRVRTCVLRAYVRACVRGCARTACVRAGGPAPARACMGQRRRLRCSPRHATPRRLIVVFGVVPLCCVSVLMVFDHNLLSTNNACNSNQKERTSPPRHATPRHKYYTHTHTYTHTHAHTHLSLIHI